MVFGTSFLSGTIDAPHSSCVFSAPALHLASSLSLSLLLGNGFIFIYFLNVSFLFKLKNYLFIYLFTFQLRWVFVAVCGLFSSCGKPLFLVMCELLIVASFVVALKRGFQ